MGNHPASTQPGPFIATPIATEPVISGLFRPFARYQASAPKTQKRPELAAFLTF
jgi:hypothetical protein